MDKLVKASFDASLNTITEHHYAIQRLTQDLNLFKGKVSTAIEVGSPVFATKFGIENIVEAAKKVKAAA